MVQKAMMRFGFALPQIGSVAGPDALVTVAKRADESIQVLKKISTTDPIEFQGKFYRIPKSFIGPKPLQKPHPPIYMAAFTPSALKRVAAEAELVSRGCPAERGRIDLRWNQGDGKGRWSQSLGAPAYYCRGRGNSQNAYPEGPDFTGTPEQIAGDFATARKLGAAEIVIYAQFLPEGESAKDFVARMQDIWNIAKQA